MTIQIHHHVEQKFLEIAMSGTLKESDYMELVPALEGLIKTNGKLRILMTMHNFHGWTPGAIWEDLKFDLKHLNDVERLAFLGEKSWQKGMTSFCKPFTTAEIRYFDLQNPMEVAAAYEWIQSSSVSTQSVRQRQSGLRVER